MEEQKKKKNKKRKKKRHTMKDESRRGGITNSLQLNKKKNGSFKCEGDGPTKKRRM